MQDENDYASTTREDWASAKEKKF